MWAYQGGTGNGEPQQAVSAWFSAFGVRSDEDACSWFAAAARALRRLRGFTCIPLPALPGEQETRVSAGELDFIDPPHVAGIGYPSGGHNPARGLLLFAPAVSDQIHTDVSATATCTLPPPEHRLCSASLNSIRAEFRGEAKPKPPY